MKVLYDISTLGNIHCASGVTGAGIFRATEELALALARRSDLELSLSAKPAQRDNAVRYLADTGKLDIDRFAIPAIGDPVPAGAAVGSLLSTRLANGALKKSLNEYLDATYSPERVYNSGRFDIYHANWGAEVVLPTEVHPTVVATVFDVIALKNPEWFVNNGGSAPAGAYLKRLLDSVSCGHGIIVNTECVKNDILEMFANISDEQVAVVPLAVAETFSLRPGGPAIEAARTKYSIPAHHRYVLCVNTVEPRKNMISAIDAFNRLAADGHADDVSLVLVGSKGWLSDEVFARAQNPSGNSSSIVVTGYVDDCDLASLYAGASLFCYPSLDEGFGLPVLEAMHAGVPVITSDRAPLVEVSGAAAIHVDPLDIDALASSMNDVLNDTELSSSMTDSGVEHVAKFTWDRSAEMTVEMYNRWAPERLRATAEINRRFYRREPAGSTARPSTELHNQSFAQLRNKFAGERLFIVGDTAAIERAPLSAMNDEFTFVFNDFADRSAGEDWKPTFYALSSDDVDEERVGRFNALTGSLFFTDASMSDRLRRGPDMIDYDLSHEGVVSGVDLLRPDTPALPVGPHRALATAIQLGYHLGFDPIVLVEPAVQNRMNGAEGEFPEAVGEWHRACREALERRGRSIGCVSVERPPFGYQSLDAYEVFAAPGLPEFVRSDHAHLDETEVISTMITDRDGEPRIMLDVGAHRGTSAQHFLKRNWRIFCFEPEEDNRRRLTAKYGKLPNITIDPRAVGAEAADGVAFFKSPESSGISGLSAFRDSHELVDHVDMTSVAEIVDQHLIEHVDFLKIDVEGFDFDVLRGVPWDRSQPDVIECEYENAKTVPLGHTTDDIIEYLRDRGYRVYLSEWHPIIRYGVRHDWRRIVPCPAVQVADGSWGNILAFRIDPGYAAVQSAFGAIVEKSESVGGSPVGVPDKVSDQTIVVPQRSADTRERRLYADWADRLKSRSPSLYGVLRLIRRAAAKALRHPLLLLAAALLFAAVVALGLSAPDAAARYAIWSAAAAATLAVMVAWVAAYSHRAAMRTASTARALGTVRRANVTEAQKTDRQLGEVRQSLTEIDRRTVAADEDFSARLNQIERRGASLRSENTSLSGEIASLRNQNRMLLDRLAVVDDSIATAVSLGERVSALESRPLDSNYANSPGLRMHSRQLHRADVKRIESFWLDRLGVSMGPRAIRYLAHQLCLDEERCEGRLATSIQAAMMRSLTLLSIQKPEIEVLEIGTLFGVGSGSLHRVGRRAGTGVFLTVIDPLNGYYGSNPRDGQTGLPISLEILVGNLASLGVPETDYRVIQHLSTDPAALEQASDRMYDFVLIDGDHSLGGVSNDFELYGPLVKPGGMLIFDDYDADDWPAIKEFVDGEVRPLDEWLWIGGEWRTGILQRKMSTPLIHTHSVRDE